MQAHQYIYFFSYDHHESALCKLESKYIFNQEDKNKLLVSNIKAEPANSAFIKKRLDIHLYSEDYNLLIDKIKEAQLKEEGFKVEYLVLDGDKTAYDQRLKKLKDIGYAIDGTPDYYNPGITYALCFYEGVWCFGELHKNGFDWHKHKQKPHSNSNSIHMHIAKSIVNIAAMSNKETKLLDACCGVGSILLEACFSDYQIEGCDINWKVCHHARKNLSHFNYTSQVYRSDIKDLEKKYDAAIIDLPYNHFTYAAEDTAQHIIESTTKITNRMVIVSTSDIKDIIEDLGFQIIDFCSIGKSGKVNFARKIWVCEKKVIEA